MGRSPKALEMGLINSFLIDNSAERLEHLQVGEFIENRQSNKETVDTVQRRPNSDSHQGVGRLEKSRWI